jgi:hypothetical protein
MYQRADLLNPVNPVAFTVTANIVKKRIVYSLICSLLMSCLISSMAIVPMTEFVVKILLGDTVQARTVYEIIGLTMYPIVFVFFFRHYYRQWARRDSAEQSG